jgi:acyl transferase domain-containing protein
MKDMNQILRKLLWGQLQAIGLLKEGQSGTANLSMKKETRDFYRKWIETSFGFLAEENYLSREGDHYLIVDSRPVNLDAAWKEWDRQKEDWMREPTLKAQVILIETMMRALPDILSGKILATTVMFPRSSMELIEGIYKSNLVADYFNGIACSAVTLFIEEMIKQNPFARIRLFEIGAGSGGTSAFIFKGLQKYRDYIEEYCYTDISKAFLLYAEKEFGTENTYLTYKIFDVEKSGVLEQDTLGKYDIIIASNVLHATKNIKRTLRNTKALLRKNGLLVLNEISDKSFFSHLTFGLLEGWWLYEDPELRIPGCPGLYPARWQAVLEEEGFQAIFFPAQQSHDLGQQIIIAESDGVLPQIREVSSDNSSQTRKQELNTVGEHRRSPEKSIPRRSGKETIDPVLEEYVRETLLKTVSEVLKMDQVLVEGDTSFVDYGLDSILGMNFVAAVSEILAIPLQATDIFDHSSVNRLTHFIVSEYKVKIASVLEQSDILLESQWSSEELVSYPEVIQEQEIVSVNLGTDALLKEPVAIIGISGRFAKSQNVEELWEHLANGDDLVEKISRWDLSRYYSEGATYCDYGSLLDDIDRFDPLFFNISGLEATYMDPQQRIFLEEAWKALEDAGYTGPDIAEKLCGVYVGCATGDYKTLFADNAPPQALWGSLNSAIAARISYYLDLQGPAITIDTACSSSLVAIHLACQGLWSRETDLALAGGIYIQTTPQYHIVADRAGMLSPTGHCYSFDNRADGMIPGEAAGVVVLKRLQEAIADGDHIYGVIKGSGINQDGTTNGITAPSLKSQERLERSVYDAFQIDPGEIQMAEAHGTGTKLGDPIEYQALSRAFRKYTDKKQYCAIGSLKTNIGHTQLASGVAGLLKVLLSLKHRQIPPSLHFESGNTNIQFEESPFYVNTRLRDWDVAPGTKRQAVISSFGATGTNAHLVIEEAPQIARRHQEKPGYVIVLSAHTTGQLQQQAEQVIAFCQREAAIDCGNMSYTLLLGRKHLKHRLACVVRDQTELEKSLSAWLAKEKSSHIYTSELREREHRETFSLRRYGNQCIQDSHKVIRINEYLEQLHVIADLYVQGYALDYDQLFADAQYARISLPTYPFARDSYWVTAGETAAVAGSTTAVSAPASVLHPLLHQNTSDLSEQRFSSSFTGREPFLAGRMWKGQRLFPESAYLEMARVAVQLSVGDWEEEPRSLRLQNVIWSKPVPIEKGNQLNLHVGLYPEEKDRIAYEIYSDNLTNGSDPIVYSQGSAVLKAATEAPAWDLSALRANNKQRVLSADQYYELLSAMGLEYDADNRFLETFSPGSNQVIAKLSLPASSADALQSYILHPGLLDAALQASVGLLINTNNSYTALFPAALQALEIFGPCALSMWAVIRSRDDSLEKVDIDVCDDQGTVRVRMEGLEIHRDGRDMLGLTQSTARPDPIPDVSTTSTPEQAVLMTFEEVWREQALSEVMASQPQTLVCFLSHPEAQQLVASTIQQLAGRHTEIIFIAQGTGFACHSRQNYSINRMNCETYQQAFQAIQSEHSKINALLYLWPLEDETCIREYSSLFFLLQSMVVARFKPDRLLLAGCSNNELDNSYLESWIGFERSLGLILPDVQVAITLGERRESENGILPEWISRLWNELQMPRLQSARYQMGKRTVYHVQPLTMQAGNSPLKAGKTYLITGGSGGLGLLLAGYLAHKFPGNLILIGRSALDASRQSQIQMLEEMGSQVLYLQADVCDPTALNEGLKQARNRFGKIHGVVHAAGLLDARPFFEKNIQDFQGVLNPKVKGTIVLDEALADEEVDFVCYFSSSSAILGDFGSCDYAIGNRFLMAYGRDRDRLQKEGKRYGKTIVINWPVWKDGKMGMSDEERTKLYLKASGQRFLEAQEGLEMFEQMLAQNSGSRLVLVGQPNRLQRFLGIADSVPKTAPRPDSTLQTPVSSAMSGKRRRPEMKGWSVEQCLEWDLKALISQLLKIPVDKLDREANLTDFGFDSISLAEFASLLMKQYTIEVTPAIFFGYPTLTRLIQYFMDNQKKTIAEMYRDREAAIYPVQPSAKEGTKKPPRSKKARFSARNSAYPVTAEPIAIIGISGRFPESRTVDAFWEILVEGQDVVKTPPEDRFVAQQGETTNWKGGWVPGVREFDPLFFGISPREAEMMDPRQRLLLQEAWSALEDAGYGTEQIASGKIGMFVGVEQGDYQFLTGMNTSITSNHDGVLAARLSYFLNLNGPTMAINTACSSGLVAAHQACLSLRNHECDTAVAAGVNLILYSGTVAAISQAGMLSRDGKCFAFDRRANGMVPGEAVAVVVLKRLSQAIADKDPIYAVIKGSGINYDGKTNGITAPSGVAQADLLKTVYDHYHINPEEIEYIVTHGTGTRLGDPVEVNALYDTFKKYTQKQGYCALTSVKTNIGHTFAASGLVNLICLVQALRHETIPASLHCEGENEYITWKESPFYVNKTARPWLKGEGKKRMGAVSAFGMSGTNAHMVVESYQPEHQVEPLPERSPYYLLTLSARTEESLREKIRELITVFQTREITQREIALISSTLMMGRQHFAYRCALIVQEKEDTIHALLQAESKGQTPNLFQGIVPRGFVGQKAMYRYIQDSLTQSQLLKGEGERYLEILQVLADLYCQGYEIPWGQLDGERKPGRIHLPTYPFLRGDYWTREAPVRESAVAVHKTIVPDAVPVEKKNVPEPSEHRLTLPLHALSPVDALEIKSSPVLEKPTGLLLHTLSAEATNQREATISITFASAAKSSTPFEPESATTSPKPLLEETLQEELALSLAQVLSVERHEIDVDTNLIDLGLDSIIGVEWIQAINKKYGTSITASAVYDHPNIRAFASHLTNVINLSNPQTREEPVVLLAQTAPHHPDLSSETGFPVTDLALVSSVSLEQIDVAPRPADGVRLDVSKDTLLEELITSLAEALVMDRHDIDPDASFIDLGLDSIIGVEWIRMINKMYGTSLTASIVYEQPNLRMLVAFLDGERRKLRGDMQPLARQSPSVSSLQELILQVQQGNVSAEEANQMFQELHPASNGHSSIR